MSIEVFHRVQCGPCERYLAPPNARGRATVSTTQDTPSFLDFSSAYAEAVRRGWSAYPLLCPDCAADKAKEGSGS